MNKKVKLFVDAHVFDGIAQGTVTYIKGLYKHLIIDPNYDIYIGGNSKEKIYENFGKSGYKFIKLSSRNKFFRLGFELPYILKKNKIEVAHFQYIVPPIKTCKYVVTIHDVLFKDFKKYFSISYRIKNGLLFYLSCFYSDRVLTVSDYSKRAIQRHFNYKKEIYVTPNAVSVNKKDVLKVNLPFKDKFILYVSRIEPRKNQALLIKVWSELKMDLKGYGLVIVGSTGIEDEEFNNTIHQLPQSQKDKFIWLEGICNKELAYLYQNCSLFVYPSAAEGFGIPPLEAAIYGANVLCSKSTAMGDFKFFGDNLFDPEDIEELKMKILRELSSENEKTDWSNIILEKYNWIQSAKILSESIREII
ncbi:MAG: glycosyltransferase family 4 protein [Carboxylicivirga sp.]|jgi:glycosyltransferase involved in cell wall biosynthesis|nr:glycosyltransferase family 4 protein [Carboxylicivirga sp.]